MSTHPPTRDTPAQPTRNTRPTPRETTDAAPMMFATDNEEPIRGLFDAESDNGDRA